MNRARCMIRDWHADDEASLVVHANNRKIWRNLLHHFPHPYTRDDARAWLAHVGALARPTHWAIEVDGQAVGGIGVDIGEGVFSRTGHFGYWLGEAYWGRGIMSSVVKMAVTRIWAEFDLVRLEASVFAWNPASMRVLEKCGFQREAVLRKSAWKDGELIDRVIFALIR
jgi:ribosomal-protein-alanine N-acetyltransferase